MKLDFHTLDVFTNKRFGGNPLAVVLGADMLPGSLMQTIAVEFNLSETAFVMQPRAEPHTARIRIFTPGGELPFAGHPSIGTAALLAEQNMPQVNGERDAIILLEEEIGPVRVGVRLGGGGAAQGEFTAPKLPNETDAVPSNDDLALVLGLIPGEIGFENHRPTAFDGGNVILFVPVADRQCLDRVSPVHPQWDEVVGKAGILGVYVYCRQPVHTTSQFQARMFAPQAGIKEDPATGAAAAAFAGAIQKFDNLPEGTHKRVIEQGFQMGRESFIGLSMTVGQGNLKAIRVSGDVVHVSSGQIEI